MATSDNTNPAGSFVSAEETLVTKDGLKKMKDELDHLKNVRRKQVAEKLKEAISYGDLSENAEYEEAKNDQAFVEGRIIELEQKIKSVRIIAERDSKGSRAKVVEVGSTVTVQNKTKKEAAETYSIVGSLEADPMAYKISNESPIGKALLGHSKGEVVEVKAPAGIFKYEVVKIS